MSPTIIAALVMILLLMGIVVFPLINKQQFNKLPDDQKVRILMKEAKKLIFFKNVSSGRTGTLYYVKNKRKIYTFPWELRDGQMVCSRKRLFENWDYPEEQPAFTEEEIRQVTEELNKYNEKQTVKLIWNDETDS